MSDLIKTLRAAGVECYTRSEWGSVQERAGAYTRRRRTHPMPKGPAKYHFLHITVTADTDTVKEGFAGAQQIERYGYSIPPMVSYQDLVTNEGRYFEGQSYGVKGTHTVNDKGIRDFAKDLNLLGYATALMQNVGDDVTDEQVRLIAMVFAARELLGYVEKHAPIYPHRLFAAKSCPGDKAMARLEEIAELKEKFVREGLPQLPTRELLRRFLYRAAKAAETGNVKDLRVNLRLAALQAAGLRKPVLTAKLWALRKRHTRDSRLVMAAATRQPLADQLWAFRKKHTR